MDAPTYLHGRRVGSLRRLDRTTNAQMREALCFLSGFDPDAFDRILDFATGDGDWARDRSEEPCPLCHGKLTVATAGPDRDGQYDTDDCPCQTGGYQP